MSGSREYWHRARRLLRLTAITLGTLTACSIVALLLFEVYLRVTDQRPMRQEVAGRFIFRNSEFYEFKPYMNFGEHPFAGQYPLAPSKRGDLTKTKDDEYRIFLFGGSVARSAGLREGATSQRSSPMFNPRGEWWARLEDKQNRNKPAGLQGVEFRVRSAGGPSYVTTNELIKLVLMNIDEYQPDLIVFLDGYNDLYGVYAYGARPGVDIMANAFITRARWPVTYALYLVSSEWLWSVAKIAESILVLDMRGRLNKAPEPSAVSDRLVRNYRRARLFSEDMGAMFMVVLQPFAVFHRRPDGVPKDDSRFWETRLIEQYTEILNATRQGLSKHDIRLLDYTGLFDRSGGPGAAVFYDSVHFWDKGYAFLVDTFFEDTSKMIFEHAAKKRKQSAD